MLMEISMHRIIIGDSHAIYRAGLAKLLSNEAGFRIVAQCQDRSQLCRAVEAYRGAIIIVASTLESDLPRLMGMIHAAKSRVIVIAENIEPSRYYITLGAIGVIFRGTTAAVLVDCVRHVAAGDSAVQPVEVPPTPDQEDLVGSNVEALLTPKELTLLWLITQSMKNREIAIQLNTTEQVVKNYLRVIFDKAGVSDRLELALFVLHHRILAAAVARAGADLETKYAIVA
jgi:DNA-binding NarL/FixJ family response regulator